ncbi:M23 family metallopeptidase [Streptomyces polyrhachis]|uniref:M23 family metallopeptidase n=1 Tax=Streptomyces polyrhachis TaxID=1282885 RepID=A0ABW2GQ41_9ACTN
MTSNAPSTDGYGFGYGTGSYDLGGYATGAYATPGYDTAAYDSAQDVAYVTTHQWDTGEQQPHTGYDPAYGTGGYAPAAEGYDSAGYEVPAVWPVGAIPQQPGPHEVWDATTAGTGYDPGYDSAYQPAADWSTDGSLSVSYDSSGHPATGWDPAGYDTPVDTAAYSFESGYEPSVEYGTYTPEAADTQEPARPEPSPGSSSDGYPGDTGAPSYGSGDTDDTGDTDNAAGPDDAAAPEPAARQRTFVRPRPRRSSPKRSALLTVAVPSLAVVGVAGMAAASVGDPQQVEVAKQAVTAADPTSVKPAAANAELDTQLTGATEEAGDFADRASRTQERLDLKEREAQERKRRAEEAARREALRPKFMLPVAEHGLSAQFGQGGVNWMSLHTGIDFPVSYGTSVRAATDGTVSTKWDYSYGNMVIVTAADGTETWYCHLSSARIRSGPVQAGTVIGYSGNSGNSTGPHLHFEVRPYGGDPIDPLTWLQNKGLNPL